MVNLADASKSAGINYAQLLQEADRLDPTKSLELLRAKRNRQETGAMRIDGRRVVGLTGAFTPATLTASGFSPSLLAQLEGQARPGRRDT